MTEVIEQITVVVVGSTITLDFGGDCQDTMKVGVPGERGGEAPYFIEPADSSWVQPFLGKCVGHVAEIRTESGASWKATLKKIQ